MTGVWFVRSCYFMSLIDRGAGYFYNKKNNGGDSMDIRALVKKEEKQLISFRRYFHEYPELSQKEFQTMEFIEDRLHEWGIETVRVPSGGVLGFLDSGKPGWTVLMRADIDALPIVEDATNLSKKKVAVSKNVGAMHACGHDGHMAMLLTETKILAEHKEDWEGKVVLMFEEAEELGKRGVPQLLRYLRDHHIHIDTCYGTHVKWDVPVGQVEIIDGSAMAGAYFFRVKIYGVGGHGSRPDQTHSPIEAFIQLGAELRNYRMMRVPPSECFTYSFGAVEGGHEPNVVPDELVFAGTARCESQEAGLNFRKALMDIVHHACVMTGCREEFLEDQFFPPTVNTKECVEVGRRAAIETCGEDVIHERTSLWMGAETFSIIEATYPGLFVLTGIYDEEVGSGYVHHAPKFDIGEKGLVTGVEVALSYVLAMLKEKPEIRSFKATDLESMLELSE